ncbi:MAG: neutral/alkaline non-lysosomal ceramidase N-terminal domain-containing protein [Dehalococcoidia bacterium]
MSGLQAGAAVADITPPPGGLMDGYGARREPSQGVHDPLYARALVLDYGEAACAIVGCDLLGMDPRITAAVRERVQSATGIASDGVVVAATHSHAGPYGLRPGMFSRYEEALAEQVVEKITGAVTDAWRARRAATLKLASAVVDTVSQNRRDPDWPVDPMLRVLLVDGEDGPVASLLSFACHATVLDATNLLLSAEFPGVACRIVQEQTKAPVVYLNGACGDVNPVWVRQDFDSVERVGQIIGGQALRLVGELRTLGPGQRAHNIRWDEFIETPAPGRIVEPRFGAARREVELPLREFAPDETYASEASELGGRLEADARRGLAEGSDARRDVMARLTRVRNERWAAVWARQRPPEAPALRTEVQALSLGGGLALLALPGEFFVETGERIRSRCGIGDVLVAGYANDYVGYVAPADAYPQGGYEPGVSPVAPEAEGIIVDASLAALAEATRE